MKALSLILILMLCVGCSADSPRTYAMGNTPCNASEGGYAAEYEEYIYYVDRSPFGGDVDYALYRVDLARTVNQLITKDEVCALNILDGWIYYSLFPHGDGIFKIKTDGTNKTKLSNDIVFYMVVRDDEIYFSNHNKQLQKMDIHGGGRTQLSDSAYPSFTLQGDWIYINKITYDDNGRRMSSPFKLKCDGSEEKPILRPEDDIVTIVDGWIYYKNGDDNKLYKTLTDDRNESHLVLEDPYFSLNVHGDWIYYSNYADSGNLYRVHNDGTQKTLLYDFPALEINIAGDTIFFITPFEDIYTQELLSLDGSPIDYYRIPQTTPSPSPIR